MERALVLISAVVLSLCLSSCIVSKRETETTPRQDESTETEQASGQNESVLKDEMPIEMGSGNDMVEHSMTENTSTEKYTSNTRISDVVDDPVFGDYGRLIFPVNSGYYGGTTLGNLSLTWYNYIDPDKTVEICNYMKDHTVNGDIIFYDIYTEEEKAADFAKRDTGLFFFKGDPSAKFAIVNAGGGFAYVGAMHDSFPHALELSKMGWHTGWRMRPGEICIG